MGHGFMMQELYGLDYTVGEEAILCMTEDFLRGIATYRLPARSKEDGREEEQKDVPHSITTHKRGY